MRNAPRTKFPTRGDRRSSDSAAYAPIVDRYTTFSGRALSNAERKVSALESRLGKSWSMYLNQVPQ